MNRADSHDKHDDAWLLARERGEAVEHPEPERARGYERLEQALARPPSREPPADFEAELFAALEREAGRRAEPALTPTSKDRSRVRRRRAFALTPLAAAAAALLAWGLTGPSAGAPSLALEIVAGERVRGEALPGSGVASRGDRLRVRASFEGAGELRVYRAARELVLRCPGEAACDEAPAGAGRSVRGEVLLAAPGRYEALLFTGPSVPPPTGRLEDDLRAAQAAGAKVSVMSPVFAR